MNQTWKVSIDRQMHDGVMVVTVAGRLGADGSGQLYDTFVQLTRTDAPPILLDLEAVDYLSSAGLHALAAAAERVHECGGTLVLCSLCEPVRLALALAGLTTRFVVEPSRPAGLERIRAPR